MSKFVKATVAAIVVAVLTVVSMSTPAGAVSTGGGADANAVDLSTPAVDLLGGAISIPALSATLSESTAPVGTYGTDAGDLLTLDIAPILSTTAVSSSSSRLPAGMTSDASVDGLDVDLLGLDLVTSGLIESEVACPPAGSVGLPTAGASVLDLVVLGNAVSVTASEVTFSAGVDMGALSDFVTATVDVTVSQVLTTTATSASAVAVRISADLSVNVLGVGIFDAQVLAVDLATSSCSEATAGSPTVLSLTPDSGPTAGGTMVTITGTDFVPGETSVTFDGLPATVISVSPDGTQAVVSTPAHPAGLVDVAVTTPGGTAMLADAFTYIPPEPAITGLDPDEGPTAGGTAVTVTGTDFVAGETTVTICGVTIPADEVDVTSTTTLTFTTPPCEPGPTDVTVTTPGGTSGPQTFTYIPPAPTITGLDPDEGPTAGGTVVTVTGTGFIVDDTTVTICGVTIPADEVDVTSTTTLTFTTPPCEPGPTDVTVTTPDGTSGPQTFTYIPPGPTVTGIDPDEGPTSGGSEVDITGEDFVPDQTTVTICGVTIPADEVDVTSTTTLTFTTPPCEPGPTDVTVTTPGGTSGPQTFTYVPPSGGPGGPGDDDDNGGDGGNDGGSGPLADTGATVDVMGMTMLGLGLLLAGLAMVGVSRVGRVAPGFLAHFGSVSGAGETDARAWRPSREFWIRARRPAAVRNWRRHR